MAAKDYLGVRKDRTREGVMTVYLSRRAGAGTTVEREGEAKN